MHVDRWTAGAIEKRGQMLAQQALHVWPALAKPDAPQPAGLRFERKPVAVRFRKQEEPVSSWKQGALKLIELFENAAPGLLVELEKNR